MNWLSWRSCLSRLLPKVQRQPNGWIARVCPLDAMPAVSRNQHVITRSKLDRFGLSFELQLGGAAQHQHPFRLVLVVPLPRGRRLPRGQNPLQTETAAAQQLVETLVRNLTGRSLKMFSTGMFMVRKFNVFNPSSHDTPAANGIIHRGLATPDGRNWATHCGVWQGPQNTGGKMGRITRTSDLPRRVTPRRNCGWKSAASMCLGWGSARS